MSRIQDIENKSTVLARVACRLALRKSLRRHPPVYRGEPFVLALVAAEESRKDFERGFLDLKKTEAILSDVDMVLAAISSRGRVDYSEVRAALRVHDRVVILLESIANMPSFMVAAADKTEPVHPIDAAVLVDAVKEVHDVPMDPAVAERIAGYPFNDVMAALRRGRSHAEALLRLENARDGGRDHGVPPLESLSGYGQAADWGRSLAADIALWRAGRLPWSDLDAGLLLSGPPGVGKSLFARSLARSCEASFVASSLAQWQATGHLGDLLKAMRATFKEAADRSPCILLLDEFDSVGDRSRFTGHNAQYCTEVVAALLECLDGAFRREGVIVLGACNHPDRLDSALLRPGRLGKHIRIGLPDREARRGIVAIHFGDGLSEEERKRVAAATDGFSGADIDQLARDARRRARTRGGEMGIDDVMAEMPPSTTIDGELRDRICIHEAGHVAVGLALDVGDLTGVMVKDSFHGETAAGGCAYFERNARLPTSEFYLNNIATALGGMAAEFIFFGDHLEGSGGQEGTDLQRAADLATTMAAQLGMGGVLNFLSARSFEELERIRRTVPSVNIKVEAMLAEQYEKAKEIVVRNSPFICELAAVLNKEGAVSGERARAIFQAQGKSDAA